MRSAGDTSLGGEARAFPRTTWGLVSRACDQAAPDHRAGLEELCRRYWKPVYRYVRIAWSKSNEDAKDLTQAFFVWLIEGGALLRYAPERGGFRAYLKVLLARFVGHQEEALRALKRGGGVRLLELDDAVLSEFQGDPRASDPAEVFDKAWVSVVVNRAIDRVRERLGAEGRSSQFQVYETYDLAPADPRPTYAEVAGRLGLKEGDVRNSLAATRAEIRAEIRAQLSETTRDEAELEEEWNALFGR